MTFLFVITVILIVLFSISLSNLISAPELKIKSNDSVKEELISVLIPARNEESNIKKCIESILPQDYNPKEIIILDDFSEDRTFEIANEYTDRNVKVIKGSELPPGWVGKNWACHQLSIISRGKYLLFIDADVTLKADTIRTAYNEIKSSNLALLSVFPTQILKNFGQYLIVPLMNWILLNFLPLILVYKIKYVPFVAANGQFMLWDKNAYILIGGHQKVKDKVVEDMELARECKKKNLKVKTFVGGNLVFCKMYNSFTDSVRGFTKNFYAGFNMNPFLFLIMITGLLIIFVSPFFFLPYSLLSIIPIGLILLSRIFISIKSKQNFLINVLLHPVQMFLMFFIGVQSVIKKQSDSLEWKNRKIST